MMKSRSLKDSQVRQELRTFLLMALCHSNTLIPLTNKKSFEHSPLSFSPCMLSELQAQWRCPLLWQKRLPLRDLSLTRQGGLSLLNYPQPRLQIRHGDKSPQALSRKRAQMFGTEIRPARVVCVATEHFSFHCCVGESEGFLFIGGWAETRQETAFISKTICWKWFTVIAIASHAAPSFILSCNYVVFVQTRRAWKMLLAVKTEQKNQISFICTLPCNNKVTPGCFNLGAGHEHAFVSQLFLTTSTGLSVRKICFFFPFFFKEGRHLE